eukprot:10293689-Karenia_brevis.AAC.1
MGGPVAPAAAVGAPGSRLSPLVNLQPCCYHHLSQAHCVLRASLPVLPTEYYQLPMPGLCSPIWGALVLLSLLDPAWG